MTDIGMIHYNSGNKEEAIKFWKVALRIDPENENAANNLNVLLVRKKELNKTDFFMNEFIEFLTIQTKKHFMKSGITKFKSKKDGKLFFKMAEATWFSKIMPEEDKLMGLNDEELKMLYFEIELNSSDVLPKFSSPNLNKELETSINSKFPFLPENGFKAVMGAGSILELAGLKREIYKEFITGLRTPSEIEKEKLKWGHSVGSILEEMVNTDSIKKQNKLIEKFIETLRKKLSIEDTKTVLNKYLSLPDNNYTDKNLL